MIFGLDIVNHQGKMTVTHMVVFELDYLASWLNILEQLQQSCGSRQRKPCNSDRNSRIAYD